MCWVIPNLWENALTAEKKILNLGNKIWVRTQKMQGYFLELNISPFFSALPQFRLL